MIFPLTGIRIPPFSECCRIRIPFRNSQDIFSLLTGAFIARRTSLDDKNETLSLHKTKSSYTDLRDKLYYVSGFYLALF